MFQRKSANRVEQLFDRISAVDRHQFISFLICRAGQRNREIGNHRLAGKPFDGRQQACGRKCDTRHRHVQAVFVVQDPNGLHDVVVVVKRLAHSHQYNIETARRGVFPLGNQGLSDDFAGSQITCQSKLAGETECAGQSTADLRRDANRVSVLLRNIYGLGKLAVF